MSAQPPTEPVAGSSGWVDAGGDRIGGLAMYFIENDNVVTSAALRAAAAAAGYTPEEIDAAEALAMKRRRLSEAAAPLRARARWVVLGAYGAVWLAFGVALLAQPGGVGFMSGLGPLLMLILTVSLAIALGLSLGWLRSRSPDPAAAGQAMAILLAVPVVLLVGVAGLCVPFVGLR